jgi:hypothetical protein
MSVDVRARQNLAALIGAVVLLLVGGYWGFVALDSWGLSEQQSEAVVRGKRYEAPGTTYVTQMINNRATSVPRTTAEAFLLQLEIAGEQADAAVAKDVYQSVSESQTVNATFKRGRITGGVQVVQVNP